MRLGKTKLSPQQEKIVKATSGLYLTVAGAGSGKTFTLICRCAYLLKRRLAKPENILLLTFSNKAAEEMKERISRFIPSAKKIIALTFHSFGAFLIRKYAHLLSISPNYSIIDEEDSLSILKDIMGKDPVFSPKLVRGLISALRNARPSSSKEEITRMYLDNMDFYLPEEKFNLLLEEVEAVRIQYESAKQKANLLDFDDLLFHLVSLLKSHKNITRQFKYVMVDEVQDVNYIQVKIAFLVSRYHKNLMFVGDDAQSIYSFRGADIRNIHLISEKKGCTLLKLERNYRSTKPILDFANLVIQNIKYCTKKTLYTDIKQGRKPLIVEAHSSVQQGYFAFSLVKKYLSISNKKTVGILYRNNYSSLSIEPYLLSNGIKYAKYGGISLLQKAHVKDFFSLLRVVHNPKDWTAWIRVLISLPFIGLQTANRLREVLVSNDEIRLKKAISFLPKKQRESLLIFFNDLFLLKKKRKEKFSDFLKSSLHLTKKLISGKYKPIEIDKRIDELKGIVRYAGNRYKSLGKFLLDFSTDRLMKNEKARVILSTIHSAKGLEFDYVILIDVIEGKFPSHRSEGNDFAVDEEWRLFYVGVTRAKEELTIVTISSQWSLFLKVLKEIAEPSLFSFYSLPKREIRIETF